MTIAHAGILWSAIPKLIQAQLICKTAEGGYSIGDVLIINPAINSNSVFAGHSLVIDATNINVRYGFDSDAYLIMSKTDGQSFGITNANWRLVISAWA